MDGTKSLSFQQETATQKMEVPVLSECGPRGNDGLMHNILIAATLITASE